MHAKKGADETAERAEQLLPTVRVLACQQVVEKAVQRLRLSAVLVDIRDRSLADGDGPSLQELGQGVLMTTSEKYIQSIAQNVSL